MSREVGSVVAANEASVGVILLFNIAGKHPLGKAILGAGGRPNSQHRRGPPVSRGEISCNTPHTTKYRACQHHFEPVPVLHIVLLAFCIATVTPVGALSSVHMSPHHGTGKAAI